MLASVSDMTNNTVAHTTLIRGSHVVTMNATRDIIRHGAVVIEGDRIVAVGKADDLLAQFPDARVVGGDRFVITPGWSIRISTSPVSP